MPEPRRAGRPAEAGPKQGLAALPDRPLNFTELDALLVHVAHLPLVRSEARRLGLTPESLSTPGTLPYGILLSALYALPPEKPASYYALQAEIAHRFADARADDAEAQQHRAKIAELLAQAYDLDQVERRLDTEHALGLVQRAASEAIARRVQEEAPRLAGNVGGYADFMAARTAEVQRIAAVGALKETAAYYDGWAPTPVVIEPTGVPWIDRPMGGHARKDVNGLLGLFEGGKTAAAVQLCVETARIYAHEHAQGLPRRVSLFVTYEEEEDAIRTRALACAAHIKKDRIEGMRDFAAEMSRTGALEPYEVEYYNQRGITDPEERLGEFERFELACREVLPYMHILDMRSEGVGFGLVDELVARIERLLEQRGLALGTVLIDYCKAMCLRHIMGLGKDPDRMLRHLITFIPSQVKQRIAERFDCAVWLLQQYNGDAQKRAPGAKMHHGDAAEAKSFAENLVFCLCLGQVVEGSDVRRLDYSKARRHIGCPRSTVVRLHGAFSRFTEALDEYEIGPTGIVERAVASLIDTGGPAPRRQGAAPRAAVSDTSWLANL